MEDGVDGEGVGGVVCMVGKEGNVEAGVVV